MGSDCWDTVSLWGDENFLKYIALMVTQLCKSTKNRWIVHTKWVRCA